MKVCRQIDDIGITTDGAVTVGSFDGVHLGHLAILDRLKGLAKTADLETTVITFDPHPQKVIGGERGRELRLLSTISEKLAVFKNEAIDRVVVIPFTRDFAGTSAEQFVRRLLVEQLKVREMVVGFNHQFGRGREGSFENLSRLAGEIGFNVHQVGPRDVDGETVSSTAIRGLLADGHIEKATAFLGRHYELSGTVIHGDGRGRQIGFPTANIQVLDDQKAVPGRGVYAVDVFIDNERYGGMMNIGIRPTFEYDLLTLEVHVFSFNADLYGKTIRIAFKAFIREEKKFSGIEDLKRQLAEDKLACEKM